MYYVIVFTLLTWAVTSSGMFHRDLYIDKNKRLDRLRIFKIDFKCNSLQSSVSKLHIDFVLTQNEQFGHVLL